MISYLTALPSRDIVQAAHQQITRDWWERRNRFDLFVSEAVLEEAARGDAKAAARRLAAVEGIPVLEVGAEVSELADQLLRTSAIPAIDAVHIAVAVVNGMHYLLTIAPTLRTPRFAVKSRIRAEASGLCRRSSARQKS